MRKFKLILGVLLAMVVGALFNSPLEGAVLSAGRVEADSRGQELTVPVTVRVSPGENISGLNFDLAFDGGKLILKSISIGPAAQQADKNLMHSQPDSNAVRVLIFGINQSVIESGVLAQVVFEVSGHASAGEIPVRIINAAASNPQGNTQDITLQGGAVVLRGVTPVFPPEKKETGHKKRDQGQSHQNVERDNATVERNQSKKQSVGREDLAGEVPHGFSEKSRQVIVKKLNEEDNSFSDVIISPNGGTFVEPVEVTLSSAVPDAEIRYTTDGDRPGRSSRKYKNPFVLNSSRTVKAALFKDGKPIGKEAAAIFDISRESKANTLERGMRQ